MGIDISAYTQDELAELIRYMTPEEREELDFLLRASVPVEERPVNGYVPQIPTKKQREFLALTNLEALFGGSASPGKSSALLMAGLQYAEEPDYSALLLRKTYADLSLPGALMDRAHTWLDSTDAQWSERDKMWRFPGGATLSFGYLESENDKYRYQSSEFQFIGFDELTQFSETMYTYLFSRLRRSIKSKIPIRMRGATNPGGRGHEWVKRRFIDANEKSGRKFLPAFIDDNPHVDKAEYIKSLNELDGVTRARLLSGDWEAREGGGMFRREWFNITDSYPADCKFVRYWDRAATEPHAGNPDPDWTAGVLMGEKGGQYWIISIDRIRATPSRVEAFIRQVAELDGERCFTTPQRVDMWIEQEGGSGSIDSIDNYRRNILKGFSVRGNRVSGKGDKTSRARPVSSAAEAGNVKIVRGKWNNDFLDEIESFPNGAHDDMVDSVSGCFEKLVIKGGNAVLEYYRLQAMKEDMRRKHSPRELETMYLVEVRGAVDGGGAVTVPYYLTKQETGKALDSLAFEYEAAGNQARADFVRAEKVRLKL